MKNVSLFPQIPNLLEYCVKNIKNPECAMADAWTMVLSNISRPAHLDEQVFIEIKDHIKEFVNIFCQIDYNKQNCHLNYLGEWKELNECSMTFIETLNTQFLPSSVCLFTGPIFSNITQIAESRDLFCKDESGLLNRLLPFMKYDESIVRKGGTVGLLRNICFDSNRHMHLLEDIDILPMLLFPLAGPEEFTDEENDMLPIELQVC